VESESDRDPTSGAESQDTGDARDELHATSESLQDDAERVGAMEAEKDSLDAADPRVSEMSDDVEQLTRNMAQKATNERALSKEIQDE
jgi:hypothetical protein